MADPIGYPSVELPQSGCAPCADANATHIKWDTVWQLPVMKVHHNASTLNCMEGTYLIREPPGRERHNLWTWAPSWFLSLLSTTPPLQLHDADAERNRSYDFGNWTSSSLDSTLKKGMSSWSSSVVHFCI